MSIKYPNPCVRCGFCCITTICPAAKELGYNDSPCPLLSFDNEDNAVCRIVAEYPETLEVMGIGKGCCIKARAYKDGIEYDFASLPPEIKKTVAKSIRKEIYECNREKTKIS